MFRHTQRHGRGFFPFSTGGRAWETLMEQWEGILLNIIHHFCLSRFHQGNTLRVAPSWSFLFVCLCVFLCGSRQWPGFPYFPCTEEEPVQSYLWNMQLRRHVQVWLASMGQFLWRDYLPDRVWFLTLPTGSLIEVHTPCLQFWNSPSSKNQRVFFNNSFGSKTWNELWGCF